jgi:hypothetical protein
MNYYSNFDYAFDPTMGPLVNLTLARQTWKVTRIGNMMTVSWPSLASAAQNSSSAFRSTIPPNMYPAIERNCPIFILDSSWNVGRVTFSGTFVYISSNPSGGNFGGTGTVEWAGGGCSFDITS